MRGWNKWRILPVFLVLLSMLPAQGVHAAGLGSALPGNEETEAMDTENGGDGSENNEEGQGAGVMLSENMEMAGEPVRELPELPETEYTTDVFYTQTTMQGIFSNRELFFYIPEYWDLKYVYVELEYDASELIQGIASSLTFRLNDAPITSYRIDYEEGSSQTCFLVIPVEQVQEGYNSLMISAYARLYEGDGCADDFTSANWLSIADSSYIRCGYDVKDAGHLISYYPYPFMSSMDDSGRGLTIAVSDQATSAELQAAMNIMADMSTETGDENRIQFCLLSDLNPAETDRTILVSEYQNLPAEYQAKAENQNRLTDSASITFTDDAYGNPLLLITSEKEECLLEAAYMLMDENRVQQAKGSSIVVASGSAEAVARTSSPSKMAAGNYTVGEITGGGLSFYGPFRQEQYVYLPFSEDYFLSDAGKVTLKFRYSANLDFNRSLITVFWGNIPVASKKLSDENKDGDELTFSMPPDVVGTTAGAIRIAFDLEIQDLVCTPRMDQMPWAYVSDESVLYLPASNGIVLTFDLKPSPFRTDGKFNDLLLLVPDEPTTETLNLYAQIVGMYGAGVNPYGTFYVKRVSEFSESDSDYNIITAGTYTGNTFLRNLNSHLYFQYEEGGQRFLSNEQMVLSEEYDQDVAIMQLLESPYAQNRGILAITAVKEEALSYVQDYMRDSDKRYSLSQDCVIIDKDLDSSSFQFIQDRTDGAEPGFIGGLTQNKKSLLFTVVATSAMLMMLIAIIIMLIRIRMYHKTKESE